MFAPYNLLVEFHIPPRLFPTADHTNSNGKLKELCDLFVAVSTDHGGDNTSTADTEACSSHDDICYRGDPERIPIQGGITIIRCGFTIILPFTVCTVYPYIT